MVKRNVFVVSQSVMVFRAPKGSFKLWGKDKGKGKGKGKGNPYRFLTVCFSGLRTAIEAGSSVRSDDDLARIVSCEATQKEMQSNTPAS